MTLPPPSLPTSDLARVVQLFIAVTDSAGRLPEAHERHRAIDLARRWAPGETPERVAAIVDTAYVAARGGVDVERVAREVCEDISHEDCLRLLSDLGRIAQADGHLSVHEARVIARIRAAVS